MPIGIAINADVKLIGTGLCFNSRVQVAALEVGVKVEGLFCKFWVIANKGQITGWFEVSVKASEVSEHVGLLLHVGVLERVGRGEGRVGRVGVVVPRTQVHDFIRVLSLG